jgi:hypothetical protein
MLNVNNGWKNFYDTENSVMLERPDREFICSGTSSVEFSKYIPHNLVALSFRVEYVAQMPSKNAVQDVRYSVGWGTFLPTLNAGQQAMDQKVEIFCDMGPAISLMKDIIWG